MKRTTTTLLAASALVLSASLAVACPFSKSGVSASNDTVVDTTRSASATPIPSGAMTSDSLATNDTKIDAPATAAD